MILYPVKIDIPCAGDIFICMFVIISNCLIHRYNFIEIFLLCKVGGMNELSRKSPEII